jgi:hypothetical protein
MFNQLPSDWDAIMSLGSYADANGWGVLIGSDQVHVRSGDVNWAATGDFPFQTNQWYQSAFVLGSNSVTLYIDGVALTSAPVQSSAVSLDTTNAFEIGTGQALVDAYPYWFNGTIDDVRIYNRALSSNEVAQLYAYESVPPGFQTNGLVAYYPFNGNANDESTNANNGTVYGAILTTDRFGNADSAFSFNGIDEYIQAPNQLNLNFPGGEFTISLWASLNDTAKLQLLIGKDMGQGIPTKWLIAYGEPNCPGVQVDLGAVQYACSGVSLSPGIWYQLLVRQDSTNYTVFVDGVLVSSQQGQFPYLPDNTAPLTIGEAESGGFVNGRLDDIRIYNRALSSNEVAALYALESTPPSPPPGFETNGLVAYYPFNGNANDESTNGNNGTVYGATLTTDRFGKANSAYSFDGLTDYISIPDAPSLDPATAISVSAWIKVAKSSTSCGIVSKFGADNSMIGQWVLKQGVLGGIQGLSGYVVNASQAAHGEAFSPGQLIDGVWHQLMMTYNGSIVVLYEDGNAVANSPLVGNIEVYPQAVEIGRWYHGLNNGGNNYYYSGLIDDVRIYNRALSSNEVGQLYAIESVPPSPPCAPYDATATATVDHEFVVAAPITDGGCGYTNTPGVRIIGGGGSGAEAVAVVSNGVVVAVNILDAGLGYTSTPVMVIEPPFIPQPTMGIAAVSLLSVTNAGSGSSYQLQVFSEGTWANIGAAFTATSSTFTQYVAGTAGPNSYRLATTPVPLQAYATAEVVDGFVIAATVTSGGSGYTTNPAVTIIGNGAGSNATAIAHVSGGSVTNVTVTDAGIGYTNGATIVIAPPPANALWPTVTQVMELDFAGLSPYDNYQLEFTPSGGGSWTNLGTPFTPTSPTSTQYISVSGNEGFFRVKYVP